MFSLQKVFRYCIPLMHIYLVKNANKVQSIKKKLKRRNKKYQVHFNILTNIYSLIKYKSYRIFKIYEYFI